MYSDPKRRTLVLLGLYEMARGSTAQDVESQRLADKLDMDHGREFSEIGRYLKEEGLIDYNNFNFIHLTHKGLKEAERILSENYSQAERRVLEAIRDMSRMTEHVNYHDLAARLRMSDNEVATYCKSLDEKGQVEFPGGDFVRMRAAAEGGDAKGGPTIQNIFNAPVRAGFIQGGHGHNQRNVFNNNPKIDETIKIILELIEQSDINASDKEDIIKDVERIQELASKEKTEDLMHRIDRRIGMVKTGIQAAEMTEKGGKLLLKVTPQLVTLWQLLTS